MLELEPRDPKMLPEGHWRRPDREEHSAVAEEEKLLLEVVSFDGPELAVYVREFVGANADTIVFRHTVALLRADTLIPVFIDDVVDPHRRVLTFPGNGTAVWKDHGSVLRLSDDRTQLIEAGSR